MEIYSRYYHIRVTWNHSPAGNSDCAFLFAESCRQPPFYTASLVRRLPTNVPFDISPRLSIRYEATYSYVAAYILEMLARLFPIDQTRQMYN